MSLPISCELLYSLETIIKSAISLIVRLCCTKNEMTQRFIDLPNNLSFYKCIYILQNWIKK